MSLAELIPERFRSAGLSESEIERAQVECGVRFPPDLRELLAETLPTGDQFPNWRASPGKAFKTFRQRIIEGIEFDVEHNSVWLSTWGERPTDPTARRESIAEQIRDAPALIPIFGHRAIPNEPLEDGNPVFSVVQTDVIVYGRDVANYLGREFASVAPGTPLAPVPNPVRSIRFWSDLDTNS